MKKEPQESSRSLLLIAGSDAFRSRTRTLITRQFPSIWIKDCSPQEIWTILLEDKPNVLFFEIGYLYNQEEHKATRALLDQIRERFSQDVYVAPVITHAEKLFYAGDLLFQEETSLEKSGFVDTFLVTPPAVTPSLPSLSEQFVHLIPLLEREFARRERGESALPSLGTDGWVQSLADPASRELWMKWLPKYAQYTEENPLIIGATGTGKTNLAFALHLLSGRTGEFISITPRDFSSSELVQAELFGAVAGAYTGAVDKWGLVKAAEKGTLFIDELQSIDRELQGKLITFIENKSYRRVGSADHTTADVRFVFASNQDLVSMMSEQVLRDDFAYRLERLLLDLQPLAQRKLDIPAAFAHGLAKIKRQRELSEPIRGLSPEAFRILFTHSWPGNLRQLENAAAKMCELAEMEGEQIITEQMVHQVLQVTTQTAATSPEEVIAIAAKRLSLSALTEGIDTIEKAIGEFEKSLRCIALEASGGDIEKASQLIQDNRQLIELSALTILSEKEQKLRNA